VIVNVGGAVPVPERVTGCGEPDALSVTVSVALKLAADTGVKVTEIVQLAPAASELPHVLVWAKLAGFVPPIAMPVIVNAALPLLVSVTAVGALVAPVVSLAKATEAGASVATGAGGTVPVPVSAVVRGEPLALSVTVSVALKLAADAGLKVTEIVQLAPAARELPQVLVWAKLVELAPPMVIPVIDNGALPELASVAV